MNSWDAADLTPIGRGNGKNQELWDWEAEQVAERVKMEAVETPGLFTPAGPPPPSWPKADDLDYEQRRKIQHEPADVCAELHCWSCGVDEPVMGRRTYVICPECGHAYYSARQLRRAYRRVTWQFVADAFQRPEIPRWAELRWWLWRALTIRASKIYFCQHCTHDF